MKSYIKAIMITGVLLLIGGFSLACASPVPAGTPVPQAIAPKTTSAFKIENLSVNPPEVNAGVEALITARITNTSVSGDSYYGKVRIDNITQPSLPTYLFTNEVNIPPGETQLMSVATSIRYPGKYKVTWDETVKELLVNPEEAKVNSYSPASATAPDFTAIDVVTGKTVSLSQFKGTAVLLNFVNYGCSPSVNDKVSSQLLAIKQLKQQRSDFVPVSVFCGCCPPEVLKQFAKQNNLDWPWILDTDNSIVAKYSGYVRKFGYPTLLFVDKDQLISEVTGYVDLSALNGKISNLVNGNLK